MTDMTPPHARERERSFVPRSYRNNPRGNMTEQQVEDFFAEHIPLASITGLSFRHRRLRRAELERVLAGQRHDPVVYFARVGKNVKIGTSTNLRGRMLALYLSLDDVLAVVPGDRHMESAYHHRFGRSRLECDGRAELFRLDLWLRLYLARCRWAVHEVVTGIGVGLAAMAWAMPFTFGVVPIVLGALASAAFLTCCFARPGWEWR